MMTSRTRLRWLVLGLAVAWCGGSACAAPTYTLTDLGLTTPFTGTSPLDSMDAIRFDAAGNITHGRTGDASGILQAGNYTAQSESSGSSVFHRTAYYGTVGGTTVPIYAPQNSSWATTAYGLNAAGTLIGTATQPGPVLVPYVYTPQGGMKMLPMFEGRQGVPFGINDLGQIVGYSADPSGYPHAALWDKGTITDLNTLIAPGSGLALLTATGINIAGQIVGQAEDLRYGTPGYGVHEFLLTPVSVPEPSVQTMAGLMMFGLTVRRIVRRRPR
jgi:probable HAF family extracellular repeat protein